MKIPALASKKKNISVAVLAVCIVGTTSIGYAAWYQWWYYPTFNEQREPAHFFWIHGLFTSDALPVLQSYPDSIDMISPAWYSLLDNGTMIANIEQENLQLLHDILSACNSSNITVHPLVSASSQGAIRALLEKQTNQQNFLDSMNDAFTNYGFDGLNIDLEGVAEDLRDEFTTWFGELKGNMPEGKILSIDVPAKTSDATTGWDGWCDYHALGDIADMFMIMTYDAHGGWTGPGEVAPTSWVREVMAYAVRAVPLEKLFIGIPRYGYDWSTDPEWPNWGYGYGYFQDKVNTYGGTLTRTGDGKELRYEYKDGEGFDHVCYYCDVETTRQKQAFLSQYPVGGYCYWHLTSGDERLFM